MFPVDLTETIYKKETSGYKSTLKLDNVLPLADDTIPADGDF